MINHAFHIHTKPYLKEKNRGYFPSPVRDFCNTNSTKTWLVKGLNDSPCKNNHGIEPPAVLTKTLLKPRNRKEKKHHGPPLTLLTAQNAYRTTTPADKKTKETLRFDPSNTLSLKDN